VDHQTDGHGAAIPLNTGIAHARQASARCDLKSHSVAFVSEVFAQRAGRPARNADGRAAVKDRAQTGNAAPESYPAKARGAWGGLAGYLPSMRAYMPRNVDATHDRLLPSRPTPGDRAPDANGCQSGARQIAEIFPTVQRKEYDLSIVGSDLSDADG
jgi:hypothetical protein